MSRSPLVEIEQVSKRFIRNKRSWFNREPDSMLHAVDDVSLAIYPGQALGLVGESGCGKSTLARIISRLMQQTSGRVSIQGRDVSALTVAQFTRTDLRRQVQLVFDDANGSLNPRFTVFQQIADPLKQLAPPATISGLQEKVLAATAMVNLSPTLLGRYPHQLSGGEKARVGIARALIVEPSLLILDEPTSALDVSVQAAILQLLDRLRREKSIALLFISHDLSIVRLLCDRIMVMYLGQVVEEGTKDQIFYHPRHPYTKELMAAIPSLRTRSKPFNLNQHGELIGEPQSPIDPSPTMCRFYGRCSQQQDICRKQAPDLIEVDDGHSVRCHLLS